MSNHSDDSRDFTALPDYVVSRNVIKGIVLSGSSVYVPREFFPQLPQGLFVMRVQGEGGEKCYSARARVTGGRRVAVELFKEHDFLCNPDRGN